MHVETGHTYAAYINLAYRDTGYILAYELCASVIAPGFSDTVCSLNLLSGKAVFSAVLVNSICAPAVLCVLCNVAERCRILHCILSAPVHLDHGLTVRTQGFCIFCNNHYACIILAEGYIIFGYLGHIAVSIGYLIRDVAVCINALYAADGNSITVHSAFGSIGNLHVVRSNYRTVINALCGFLCALLRLCSFGLDIILTGTLGNAVGSVVQAVAVIYFADITQRNVSGNL